MRYARTLALAALLVVAGGAVWLQDARGVSAQATEPRHRMTKITESIYRADAAGTPGINSTSWVFINDSDVLVTDSEGSLASARSILAGVASVTPKPVRYLVDTHFHIDHAYGNAALPASVQIIGSDFTRRSLLGPIARQGVTFHNFSDPFAGRVETLKKQVASEADPARKATLAQQLALQEASLAFYTSDFPLQPPSVTVRQSTSIWSGNKEFQILYLGRAHTAGDVIVYVPSEKAAANGDTLFKATVGWQGDAYVNDHPATLDALKALDIELLLPGHGDHIAGRANVETAIANMQGYLREEWRQVSEAKRAGATPDAALAKLDFARFRDIYGNGVTPSLAAVRRIYDIIDGKVDERN